MGMVKRMMENIYYDSLDRTSTIQSLAEKYDVPEDFVEDSIVMMSEALDGEEGQ